MISSQTYAEKSADDSGNGLSPETHPSEGIAVFHCVLKMQGGLEKIPRSVEDCIPGRTVAGELAPPSCRLFGGGNMSGTYNMTSREVSCENKFNNSLSWGEMPLPVDW